MYINGCLSCINVNLKFCVSHYIYWRIFGRISIINLSHKFIIFFKMNQHFSQDVNRIFNCYITRCRMKRNFLMIKYSFLLLSLASITQVCPLCGNYLSQFFIESLSDLWTGHPRETTPPEHLTAFHSRPKNVWKDTGGASEFVLQFLPCMY